MFDHIISINREMRKTISLKINPDGSLAVKIPWLMPKKFAFDFIEKKKAWILKRQEQLAEKREIVTRRNFTEGKEVLYLGEKFALQISHKISEPVVFDEGFYLNTFNKKNARRYFINWYKKQALEKLHERVTFYSEKHSLVYQKITLSEATTKWGSCSHDNKLSFNWKLIMAPLAVMDYVVVHELSHTKHKNHSKKFWSFVEEMYSEYKFYRKWLRTNGHMLEI